MNAERGTLQAIALNAERGTLQAIALNAERGTLQAIALNAEGVREVQPGVGACDNPGINQYALATLKALANAFSVSTLFARDDPGLCQPVGWNWQTPSAFTFQTTSTVREPAQPTTTADNLVPQTTTTADNHHRRQPAPQTTSTADNQHRRQSAPQTISTADYQHRRQPSNADNQQR